MMIKPIKTLQLWVITSLLVAFLQISGTAFAVCEDGSTHEMRQCLSAEYEKVDKQLNTLYQQVMTHQDETGKKLLIKAEQDWIQYRDTRCAFVADQFRGGTFAPVMQLMCLVDRTQDRLSDLEGHNKD